MLPSDYRKPEEVLKPEHLQEYTTFHKDLYGRLIHLNTSIQILEIISTYPLDKLFAPSEAVFLEMLYWNFTYTCIVMLNALLNDPKGLTILRLKNNLAKSWIPKHEKKSFNTRLRNARFSDKFRVLKKRLSDIRHKIIAHRDLQFADGSLKIAGLAIPDLRKLYNETEALFLFVHFTLNMEQACMKTAWLRVNLYRRTSNT
jgi:hypothetical protein